ncbi:unnamed protein product [Blepharisma stoltei]|uniref:Uncharacterized protein n=1 Tax=Blepharisma stoltei TaxID=1481888 RepID=A0AAU9IIH4_9CILI|nr:unnamed protein product [Blepharisma stoltei]
MDSKNDDPTFMVDDSNYLALRSIYTQGKSVLSEAETLIVDQSSIERIPGGWLYNKYSKHHIIFLRGLNLLGLTCELSGFIAGEYFSRFGERSAPTNESPFTIDPYFESSIWIFILVLSVFLIPVLFKKSTNSISFLSEKLKYYHFPVCVLLGAYIFSRRLYSETISFIFNDLILIIVGILLVIVYSNIKYEEDGRYMVTWLEYIGIHLQFSVLVALVLVELCRCIIITIIKIDKAQSDEMFGMSFNSWTVLIMSVLFVLGVIFMTMYKDIYFAAVLGYNFFGVYVMQRSSCIEENCYDDVQEAALILGSLTYGFIFLTILFYPRLICYNLRARR